MKMTCSIFLFVLIGLSVQAKNYSVSDHYDGKHFFNTYKHEMKSWWQLLKWPMTSDAAPWPEFVPNKDYPAPVLGNAKFALTFINHSTFLVQFPGLTLITDPVFSERVSPVNFVGPKRVRRPGLEFEDLPTIDVVLISHDHYDHTDLPALKRLDAKFRPLFLVPLGDEEPLKKAGLQNVREMDWWEEVTLKEVRIIFTPAQHWSGRGLFDRLESLWGGYMMEHQGQRVFFAGDTGHSPHFVDIKMRLGAPDVSLLPIGSYRPRWFMQNYHMDPEEAVRAHQELGSALSFGMHFGTFQISDEGIDRPVQDLKKALKRSKIENFKLLDFGETSWQWR